MTVTEVDWPVDLPMSPYHLVDWREACSALRVSNDTLLKLCAEANVLVIRMSARKRALRAVDLAHMVKSHGRPAHTYAVVKGAA